MQSFEYLQITINYYSSGENAAGLSNNDEPVVWKGLENYLEFLNIQGWSLVTQTKADEKQVRTYLFKKQIE